MLITVRVHTAAKQEGVLEGLKRLEISVKEKPRDGEANARVRMLLASHYNVPLSRVTLVKGHRQSSKIFSVDNEPR